MSKLATKDDIAKVRRELAIVRDTLATMIAWMASSANSPLRLDEAETLLKQLIKP